MLELGLGIKTGIKKRYKKALFWHADVIITSFPKCGRTWLRVLLGQAIQEHLQTTNKRMPMLEPLATLFHPSVPNFLLDHGGATFYATPEDLEPTKARYARKKVVLVVREPKDVTVSAYFHKIKRKKDNFEMSFSDFLRDNEGSLSTYLTYLNQWASARNVPSGFLVVRYEDMHSQAEVELRRIFDFVGMPDISQDSISRAVEFGRFDNMRKLEQSDAFGSERLRPANANDESSYKTRKGEVGGFVEHFSAEDLAYAEALIEKLDPIYGYQ